MSRIIAMLICATALVWGGCSEKSSDGIGPDIEHAGGGSDDGYTFVKNVTGYTGSSAAVTSAYLKIYRKGGSYYAKVTSGDTYSLCSKNSGYSSSYTGRDPKKKYKYCAKIYVLTYYFDL
ncbi:MAG: hypothetical protein K2K30_06280 [Alistipes sp.]|nr:hypothetical protein [Alistipes sp.]